MEQFPLAETPQGKMIHTSSYDVLDKLAEIIQGKQVGEQITAETMITLVDKYIELYNLVFK
jgi:hypothetical protein